MSSTDLLFSIKVDSRQAVAELEKFRKNFAMQIGEAQKGGTASFGKFERDASGSVKQLEHTSKQSFGHIEQEAKTSASSIAHSFVGGFSSIISMATGVFGGNLLTSAVSKLAGGLKDEITTGFNFLDLQERAKIGFATIFRNAGASGEEAATKATAHLQELVDFGAKTPFKTSQLIELSQKLQAVGFKAKEVVPMLTAVGDAVAGMGGDPQKLDRILLALGQMKTAGKVAGDDIRQLAEAGVPAWKYLAEYAGKSVEQVQKLAHSNQLDADVAVKVIVAGMGRDFKGLMKDTEGTYSSMWSTIEDLNQQRAAQAFEPSFHEVKKGMAAAIMGLESGAGEGFAKGAAGVQQAVLGGFDKILAGLASGDFKELGFGALDAVVTGAKTGAKGLYDAGVNAGAELEQGWRDRMEQHSPSEVMRRLGFDAGLSLYTGFMQSTKGQQLRVEIEKIIEEAAAAYGIDPNLIRAMMKQESSGKRTAVSPTGAKGLLQLMPGTAARYGVTNSFDPQQNIFGGAHYMADLLKMFGGDERLALAAYNAGEGRGKSKTPEARLNTLIERNTDGVGDYVKIIMQTHEQLNKSFNELDAAVHDLAGSTNWRNREGKPFGDLSEEQQFEAVKRLPGFREWMQKRYGQTDYVPGSRDLQGGTGVFAKPAPLPATVPTIKSIDASKYLTPSAIDESSLTSGAKGATQVHYELLKTLAQVGDTAEQSYDKAGKATQQYGSLTKGSEDKLNDLHEALKALKEETDFSAMQLAGETAGQLFVNLKNSVLNSVSAIISGSKGLKGALVDIFRQTLVATADFIAKKAALKGLEEMAEGFSDLANPFMFWHAPTHFYAAAAWFALAGGAATGGRLIAATGGGGAADSSAGASSGASSSTGSTSPQPIVQGRTGGASDPNVIQLSRNAPPVQPIILHIESNTRNEPGTLTEHVVNVVSSDPRVKVVVRDHLISGLNSASYDSGVRDAVDEAAHHAYYQNGRLRETILNET